MGNSKLELGMNVLLEKGPESGGNEVTWDFTWVLVGIYVLLIKDGLGLIGEEFNFLWWNKVFAFLEGGTTLIFTEKREERHSNYVYKIGLMIGTASIVPYKHNQS